MRRFSIPAGLMALAMSGVAQAGDTVVIGKHDFDSGPDWKRGSTPSPASYAKLPQVNGDAVVRCNVTAQGKVAGCIVVSESPAGQGVGDSALYLAARFRFAPARKDGRAVEGDVQFPIHLRCPSCRPRR